MKEEIKEILQKYPCIDAYYGNHVTKLIDAKSPLINLVRNGADTCDLLNNWLEKINTNPNIGHLIKKSKNPIDFFSIMSEFKVASFLIDKVGKKNLTIISSDGSSPDFKIEKSGETFTIEVKIVEDKRDTKKGEVKYNPNPKVLNYEFEDTQTIYNHITDSIKKHQYSLNIPHIIVFDCESPWSATSIDEWEFEKVLYGKKDESGVTPTTGHYYEYEGVFSKKNKGGNFTYSCLSGVTAFLASQDILYPEKRSVNHRDSRIVFFRNPNADLNIDKDILNSLEMEIREIKEDEIERRK